MIKRIGTLALIVGLLLGSYTLYEYIDFKIGEKRNLEIAKNKINVVKDKEIKEKERNGEERVVEMEGDNKGDVTKSSKKEEEEFEVEEGETFGVVRVPKINLKTSITEGVEMETLRYGAGKYAQTSYPGQNNQIFLTGHNDSAFKGLEKLDEGDRIFVDMEYGTYEYEVFESVVVGEEETYRIETDLGEEELVLMNCYPNTVVNPDYRLLLYAKPFLKE